MYYESEELRTARTHDQIGVAKVVTINDEEPPCVSYRSQFDEVHSTRPVNLKFPMFGGIESTYYRNRLITLMSSGSLCKDKPFTGIVAVDCFDRTDEVFKRIVSYELSCGYNWQGEENKLEAYRLVNDCNEKSYTLNCCFDLVANAYMASQMRWINVPVKKMLYGVPDYLSHMNEKIETKYGHIVDTFYLTVLSTADAGANQLIMDCFHDTLEKRQQ